MAIEYFIGNIFNSDCQAWVNPVNCVGVSRTPLAERFEAQFPEYFQVYQTECVRGMLKEAFKDFPGLPGEATPGGEPGDKLAPGLVSVFRNYQAHEGPEFIISFAVQQHWSDPIHDDVLSRGLFHLVRECQRLNIKSVAIPSLVNGFYNVPWELERQLMQYRFHDEGRFVSWDVFMPTSCINPFRVEVTDADLNGSIEDFMGKVEAQLSVLLDDVEFFIVNRPGTTFSSVFSLSWRVSPASPTFHIEVPVINGADIREALFLIASISDLALKRMTDNEILSIPQRFVEAA